MAAETVRYFETRRGVLVLWTGMLAGPVLWFLNQQANLLLVRWACSSGSVLILHVITLACLALTVAAGLLAWRNGRRIRSATDDDELTGSRAHFMAFLGVTISALFALVIVAQGIPILVLDPCTS